MKKHNLKSGLTLVEVVIAMSIFSLTTLAVTTAFAACFKYSSRNTRRDYELNVQQTSIEKGVDGGVQVFEDSFNTKRAITYTSPTGMGASVWSAFSTWSCAPNPEVAAYNAKNTEFNDSLGVNFNLKTFASQKIGSGVTVSDPTNNCFLLYFENQSSTDMDFRIYLEDGTKIYTGNYNGDHYETCSPMYTVALPAYVVGSDYLTDSRIDSVDSDGNPTYSLVDVSTLPSIRYLGIKMDPTPGVNPNPSITIDCISHGGIDAVSRVTISRNNFLGAVNGRYNITIDTNGILSALPAS